MNQPNPANLCLSDFDYDLPEALIARFPLDKRSASRLLCVNSHALHDRHMSDLPRLLQAGDLLVFNDTKVMKARLFGQKETGGRVEILVEKLIDECTALCHVRASKRPKIDSRLNVHGCSLTVLGRRESLFVLKFSAPILSFLEQFGSMPIPPYFNRPSELLDDNRYQTVFCHPDKQASVAAPTASLHFDHALLQALKNKGIDSTFITLHVGAGTFLPIKNSIATHVMHKEFAELPAAAAAAICATKKRGGRVIAVGTTVMRTLESAWQQTKSLGQDAPLAPWAGDTDIFIYPPYRFGVADGLLTNFHLPKSTLLLLVCAFAGSQTIHRAYEHAIAQGYRFFSYGDAMLLSRCDLPRYGDFANNGNS